MSSLQHYVCSLQPHVCSLQPCCVQPAAPRVQPAAPRVQVVLNKMAERPRPDEIQKAFRLFDQGQKGKAGPQ